MTPLERLEKAALAYASFKPNNASRPAQKATHELSEAAYAYAQWKQEKSP